MKKTSRVADKENEHSLRQKEPVSNPINDKILKFGKSIRARLSQKAQITNRRASQPLQESLSFSNRQSQDLQSGKPILEDISKMSVSFISQFHGDSDSQSVSMSSSKINMSKMKSVRFMETDRCESVSMSKSSRKSQSILKNSNSSDKLSSNSVTSHVGSISGGLSIKASLKDKGVNCDNKKYQNNLKILTYQGKKFFDDMFPPGGASLFHSKTLTNSKKDIRWMRVEEIFPGKKLALYSHEDRNIVKEGEFPEVGYMATSFNALGTSQRCIQRIFQHQTFSKYGIYYLRLNHQGIWKYTVVDDFIPVRQVDKGFLPVFMNVCPTSSNYIQIWPFLLQKALAKMYSTYECLFNDSVENLMHELTGVSAEELLLTPQTAQANQLKIKSLLLSKDNILMGHSISNNQSLALVEHKGSAHTYFTTEIQLQPLSSSHTHQSAPIPLQSLHFHFPKLSLYTVDNSHYSVGCVIKQQIGTFSLRTFKVEAYGQCVLSVAQKDRKYFRGNGYEYCWMRLLVVCKDLEGYRYINGVYGREKVVHVSCHLSPGEYFILVCGDWSKKVYDVTLNYQGSLETEIKREPITKYPNIIDETCRDIAQRFGTFLQINKNVCSYQYCDKLNGLFIQNFNNQVDRQVYFHRAYKVTLKNYISLGRAKFLEDQNSKKKTKKGNDHQIQTFLEPEGNMTLVLMAVGGINESQFNEFKCI